MLLTYVVITVYTLFVNAILSLMQDAQGSVLLQRALGNIAFRLAQEAAS